MPQGDGTGPRGSGSMTGRGMGYCAGYAQPGFASAGQGLADANPGAGFGRGSRGNRNQYRATGLTGWQRAERGVQAWGAAPLASGTMPARPAALDDLRARAARLENELGEVREALARLQAE